MLCLGYCNAALKIEVQLSFSVLIFYWSKTSSGLARPCSKSVFSVLRNLHTAFFCGCTIHFIPAHRVGGVPVFLALCSISSLEIFWGWLFWGASVIPGCSLTGISIRVVLEYVFHVLYGHLGAFFAEMSIWFLPASGLIAFLIMSCGGFPWWLSW